MDTPGRGERGFTLIELSIVLVVIGLIVGGVLVGQNLIAAATLRAQITQIEKFNTAANTFYGKYGALPGDLNQAIATAFGFAARGQYAGEGDGNGVIEGVSANSPGLNSGSIDSAGETIMFWADLTKAGLIEGTFNSASSTIPAAPINSPGPMIDTYLPAAKLGAGNYVYVYSGLAYGTTNPSNRFGLSYITAIVSTIASKPGITVAQAYAIDKKIDDGMPMSGNVTAEYVNTIPSWAPPWPNVDSGIPGYSVALSGSSSTCFDNGSTTAPEYYSVEISNGANVNCALSFKMQAGN